MLNTILTLLQAAAVTDSAVTAELDTTTKAVAALANPETFVSGEYEEIFKMLTEKLVNFAADMSGKIIAALLVFFIGKMIIKKIKAIIGTIIEKRDVDPSLASFVKSLINVILYFILIIILIGIIGLETSSFVALFASAGVAIGMALSGTLQNFAGGVMILLFRPFKVGDYISAQGNEGTVTEIQIFNTLIKTADGKIVIMPNGGLSTSVMTNFSKEGTRRIHWTFGIGYGDDVDKAKKIVMEILKANEMVLDNPAPMVAVESLNASSVDLITLAWVDGANYWTVLFGINEAVYKEFTKQGINIPYPQMDVHVVK